jgi:transposase
MRALPQDDLDQCRGMAAWTQGLSDWIGDHTRAFAFVGGVPTMVVSDNLRSGITSTESRRYATCARLPGLELQQPACRGGSAQA